MKRRQPPGWVALIPVIWALLGVAFLLVVGWLIGPAHAQTFPCGRYADIQHGLTNIGERVMVEGVAANGVVMQLWVHPGTRTFTVIVKMPDGRACMMISGDGLEEGQPPEGKPL